jgi:hypothetical protein
MINFKEDILDEIDPSEETGEYESDFHSAESEQAYIINARKPKKIKTKMHKTRPKREINDRELEKQPNYDLYTLERRFILQKFNKVASKLYNQDAAKDYRTLKSDFNLEMLNSKITSYNDL